MTRGRVQVTDVVSAVAAVIAAVALAPLYYVFIDRLAAESGPLTSVLLELVVPSIMLALVISIGISAARRFGGGSR